jgi:GNAT superfamily N-acetyltransferase
MPIVNIQGVGQVNFPDTMSNEQIQSAIEKEILPKFPEVQAQVPRGIIGGAKDLGASFVAGLGNTLQVPGQLGELIGFQRTGDLPDREKTGLQSIGQQLQTFGQEAKSPTLVAKEQLRAREMEKTEGFFDEAGTMLRTTATDPALLSSFFVEQLPNFIGSYGIGALGKGGAKLLMKEATEASLAKVGVSTAIGGNAVMQGTDIGYDTYQSVYKELRKQGVPEEEAQGIALSKGRIAALEAAGISLAATKLPGGASIERAMLGKGLPGTTGFLKSTLGETFSEALEEGGGAFAKQIALNEVNPEIGLLKGVGAATALGGLGGALMGAPAGVVNAMRARAEAQQPAIEPPPPEMTGEIPVEPPVEIPVQPPVQVSEPLPSGVPEAPVETPPVIQPPVEAPVSAAPPVTTPPTFEEEDPFKNYFTGMPEGLDILFQNRDRSTPASIAQMQSIAAAPDYSRVSQSRDFGNGAPVVISDIDLEGSLARNPDQPLAVTGMKDFAVLPDGTRVPMMYAVVENGILLTSNNADGSKRSTYEDQTKPGLRAIAGNGRIAGITRAYTGLEGSAEKYKKDLIADAGNLGINPEVIKNMSAPVLVRVMPKSYLTPDIADLSNRPTVARLSPVETAKNDIRRFDLGGLEFNEDGTPSGKTLMQFINAMPVEERTELTDKKGQPTTQAIDRLANAIFQKAYGSDALIDLYAQAADPEAKTILNALARVAPKMAQLEGAGEYDVRSALIQAAEMAVNARRSGMKLADAARQVSIDADPNAGLVLNMFAENSRSGKKIGERLNALADEALAQVQAGGTDMFGAVPKKPIAEIYKALQTPAGEPGLFDEPAPKTEVPKFVIDDEGEKLDYPLIVDMANKGYKVLGFDNPRTYKNKGGVKYRTIEKDGVRLAFEANQILFSDPKYPNRPPQLGYGNPNQVTWHFIGVDPKQRKQGKATQAIKDLIDVADKNNYTLYGEPAQLEKGGMTAEQLSQFYSKFGFEPSEVSNKVIVREPNQAAKAEAKPVSEPIDFDIDKPKEKIAKEIKGLTIPELAQWSIDNAPNSAARAVAIKVKKIMDDFAAKNMFPNKVTVRNGANRWKSGTRGRTSYRYSPLGVKFSLDFNGVLANGEADRLTGTNYITILHELLHVATTGELQFIAQESQAYKDLSSILTKVRKQVKEDIAAGKKSPVLSKIAGGSNTIKNVKELVSWGLTDTDFQLYLRDIKIGKKNNLFNDLVEAFRKLLGINEEYETALEAIVRATDQILEKPLGELRADIAKTGIRFEGQQSEGVDTSKLPPGRSRELAEAAQKVREGSMTREQFETLVNKYAPIAPIPAPRQPASNEAMRNALATNQKDKLNPEITDGTPVGLRMDINALRKGASVVSIHQGSNTSKVGQVIGYGSVASATDVKFSNRNQQALLKVAAGEGKLPAQTMEGKYKNISPEEAYKRVTELLNDSEWTQIGVDPTRHGYFYDRSNAMPVKSADELIQVGNFVLAKNAQYDAKENYLYEKVGKDQEKVQTNLPAFKRWFGDSKVVNEDGSPKVVYHGTDKPDFNIFNPASWFTENTEEANAYTNDQYLKKRERLLNKYTLSEDTSAVGQTVPYVSVLSDLPKLEVGKIYAEGGEDGPVYKYLGKNKFEVLKNVVVDHDSFEYEMDGGQSIKLKKGYSQQAIDQINDTIEYAKEFVGGEGGRVYPVYLSIKNPLYLDAMQINGFSERLGKSKEDIQKQIDKWKSQGYDGIITTSDEANFFPEVREAFGGIPKQYIPFDSNQIKSAVGNTGAFSPEKMEIEEENIGEKVAAKTKQALQKRKMPEGVFSDVDPGLMDIAKPLFYPEQKTIVDKVAGMKDDFFKKLAQGVADQYRSIKDYSEVGYMQARMSKTVDGALEGLTFFGHVFNNGGALDIKKNTKGLMEILKPVGKEVDRYQMWVALNREANLPMEKRTKMAGIGELIKRRNEFAAGTIDGKNRVDVYEKVRSDMNGLNKSVLKVALDAGLIDSSRQKIEDIKSRDYLTGADREILTRQFRDEIERIEAKKAMNVTEDDKQTLKDYRAIIRDINGMEKMTPDIQNELIQYYTDNPGAFERFSADINYIPFYRAMEDGDLQGASTASGLTNQQFSRELKGGERAYGDLMENTMRNWSHILSAAMKNQASNTILNDATEMGAATPNLKVQYTLDDDGKVVSRSSGEVIGDGSVKPYMTTADKGAIKVMRDGQPIYYRVLDPMLLDSISSIGYMGPKSKFLDVARDFKNMLQFGVTVSPAFKVRNLFRDSVSALAVTDLKKNPFANVIDGWISSDRNNPAHISALAGGAIFNFGTAYEGDQSKLIKRLLDKGVDANTILDSPEKVKQGLTVLWEKYKDWGNKSESANRMALYNQLKAKGYDHLQASFYARDLLDFSMQGAWPAFRLAAQTIPFLNARVQGLYKLGRDGVVPTSRVLYNTLTGKEIDANDAQKARSFSYTTGAVALASMLLYLAFKDDEEYQKREQWDRDNFWWIRLPGMDFAFRIPKPFEIGAFGTMAERVLEQIVDKDAEGKAFGDSVFRMLTDTFAINPIPQVVRPLMDIYANKDSFTGAPIESAGMERLSKQERVTDNTSPIAQALGGISSLLGDKASLSPVQVDYAIKAYFGWLGGTATQMSVYAVQPFKDGEYPDLRLMDKVSQGFLKSLPSDQSRYVTAFYENNKQISQAYADMRHYAELGDSAKVQKILEEQGDKIALSKMYDKNAKEMAKVRAHIRIISNDPNMDGTTKREMLDRMRLIISDLAEQSESARKFLKQ